MTAVHHSAIWVRDVDTSLRFWRGGLGFEVLMDHRFRGDWPTLLGAPSRDLRAVFLGAPAGPGHGFLLLSVMTDVGAALERLGALGLGGPPRRIEVAGVAMCTVVDPDGVTVELVDRGASANLDRLGAR